MKNRFWTIITIVAVVTVMFWLRNWYRAPGLPTPPKLIVGTTPDYAPFTFKKGNEIVGFDIDLAREVAKQLGKEIEFKEMPFQLLITQAQEGGIQLIAAGISSTPQRETLVTFTQPYITKDPLVVVYRTDSPRINSVKDLSGKTIIVNPGYTAENYFMQIPNITLERIPTITEAAKKLISKKGDLFITTLSTLKPLLDQFGNTAFSFFIINDVDENIALAISPRYPNLVKDVNRIINELIADGSVKKLREKWHLQ
ncbi:MAG: amino acid ABC transporter substrate-binding protein [Candidatus Babeliaceae bacterium]|nr:amino acid ABC transporter substrate-binding protein [Candidatus Babeliaceae bacterium]